MLLPMIALACACEAARGPGQPSLAPGASPQEATGAASTSSRGDLPPGSWAHYPEHRVPARVLVVGHSFTGRTHLAVETIAEALGADAMTVFAPPPGPELSGGQAPLPHFAREGHATTLEQAEAALSDPGVDVVFLGSPIWARPTPVVLQLVDHATLAGKFVVPFVTHMQQFDHRTLAELRDHLLARGAEVAEPLILRIPMHLPRTEARAFVVRRLQARTDLWWSREASVAPRCAPGTGPRSAERCVVPDGLAWVSVPRVVDRGTYVYDLAPRLVRVPGFLLDRAEVTVGEHREAVQAGRGPAQAVWIESCEQLTAGHPELPMPCMAAAEADAWCRANGGRLPSLAEHVRAARGDGTQAYPWGDGFAFDGRHGNFGEDANGARRESCCPDRDASFVSDGYSGLSPACSFPAGASRSGACDLVGNLAEWVTVPGETATDLPGATLAGGSYFDCEPEAWSLDRTVPGPAFVAFDGTGFRCAYDR
jgi:formylglycine-generating enzyme required for sulfatase activity